jgi:hypothetical protein
MHASTASAHLWCIGLINDNSLVSGRLLCVARVLSRIERACIAANRAILWLVRSCPLWSCRIQWLFYKPTWANSKDGCSRGPLSTAWSSLPLSWAVSCPGASFLWIPPWLEAIEDIKQHGDSSLLPLSSSYHKGREIMAHHRGSGSGVEGNRFPLLYFDSQLFQTFFFFFFFPREKHKDPGPFICVI